MKLKFNRHLAFAIVFFVALARITAQCSFSGLASSYCTNSPNSTLVPTATGGAFSGNGITGSVFSPSLAGPGTHTISYGICTTSYAVSSSATNAAVVYSPQSIVSSGESFVTLSDDQLSSGFSIGFTFKFFCSSYTTFYISSNGFISFNPSSGNGCCSGGFLPTGTTPDNLVASCWTDLFPPGGGSISYGTLGTAPNRTLVVNYNSIPYFSGTGNVTQQIKLFETSNIIEIHTTNKSANASVATMGIQNAGGTISYTLAGRNAVANWSASNEAIRFTPQLTCVSSQTTLVSPTSVSVSGPGLLCSSASSTLTALGNNSTYTWTGGASSNASFVVINPSTTTNYSVSATNSAGCISNAVVTVSVGLPALSTAASSNSVCLGQQITLTGSGASTYTWSGGVINGVPFTPQANTVYTLTGGNTCGTSTALVNVTVTPLPVSVSASQPSVCAGSPATLNATSSGISYTWSPVSFTGANLIVVSPLVSTIYTVATSNGSCLGQATVALNAVPAPTITVAATSTQVCDGSSATLTANGGISYLWNPGAISGPVLTVSPSSSTLYTVTAQNAAGCQAGTSQVIVVTATPNLVLNASSYYVCIGSSATLAVSGADTYTWSSGGTSSVEVVSPFQHTTYSVTGTTTLNQCQSTSTVDIDVIVPLITVSGNIAICNGGSANLTASGATSYTWSNGITGPAVTLSPTSSTAYTLSSVTATNGLSCGTTITVQIIVNPSPTITVSSLSKTICKGESVVLTAAGANTYTWSNGAHTATASASSTLVTTLVYTVTGSNALGCSSSTVAQVKVNGCNGIAENITGDTGGFMVFPNPNNGEFKIVGGREMRLTLTDAIGRLIRTLELNDMNNLTVTITDVPGGVYFISCRERCGLSKKIIVSR